jgi:hypothetical protein
VLVIGAGASKDLNQGFHLGPELIKDISDRVTDRTSPTQRNLSNLLQRLGYDDSVCQDFVGHLDKYAHEAEFPSIDEFLNEVSSYPEFRLSKERFLQIGKFSIVFHILGSEGALRNLGLAPSSWIRSLIAFIKSARLLESGEPGIDLKIITFNYDRIIEYFLYSSEVTRDHPEVVKRFLTNSVVHVYGKIGSLSWQDPNDFFEFGEDNDRAEKIFSKKNAISLMYSERNNRERTGAEWLHSIETDNVCVFGFNFDLINTRLLALENLGIVNPNAKLIANVYPHHADGFKNRRLMAKRIRELRHDAEITYLTCREFLEYVFAKYS